MPKPPLRSLHRAAPASLFKKAFNVRFSTNLLPEDFDESGNLIKAAAGGGEPPAAVAPESKASALEKFRAAGDDVSGPI